MVAVPCVGISVQQEVKEVISSLRNYEVLNTCTYTSGKYLWYIKNEIKTPFSQLKCAFSFFFPPKWALKLLGHKYLSLCELIYDSVTQ